MRGDLRYAARIIFRQPLASAVVVLTIALGIGVNVAVFSLADAVLLRPLPYPAPAELVRVTGYDANFGRIPFAYVDYLDWRAGQRTFKAIAAHTLDNFNLKAGSQPIRRVAGAVVTANFFPLLGLPPAMGRTFTEIEDQRLIGPTPIVVTEKFWRKELGRDPAVIGQIFTLNESPCEVVGVASPEVEQPGNVDIYLPAGYLAGTPACTSREEHNFFGIGRLDDGKTPAEAEADLKRIAASLAKLYPETNADSSVAVSADLDRSIRKYRGASYLLLGAAGLVLLIASVNVVNLRMSQVAGKSTEWAIRAALGASFARLAALVTMEGAVLVLAGGIFGVLGAWWARGAIVALAPPEIPRLQQVQLDIFFLGFSLLLLAAVTVIVGVIPALQLRRANLAQRLQSAGRSSSHGKLARRLQSASVILQAAFSFALYMGAALFLRTLWQLQDTPLGFDPHHLLTAQISLSPKQYADNHKITQFFDGLVTRVDGLAGVERAATSNAPPFGPLKIRTSLMPADREPLTGEQIPKAAGEYVSEGYFETLKLSLREGRQFSAQDSADGQPVVIIDEMLAQRFWPGKSALGAQLIAPNDPARKPLTVVGVVGSVFHDEVAASKRSHSIYFPMKQRATPYATLLVRTKSGYDPLALVPALGKLVASIDPNQPLYNVRPMTTAVSATLGAYRVVAYLVALFSILALVLIGVGLYGVLALVVTRRTREIGIRMALGAERGVIVRAILRNGLLLTLLGIALGVCGTLAVSRVLSTLVPGSSRLELPMFGEAAFVLGMVALVAALVPAWRASRIDPNVAIRGEL